MSRWKAAARSLCVAGLALVLPRGADAVGDCPRFAPGIAVGDVATPTLDEASGLAASRAMPGVLWSHNDSDGSPWLFAIAIDGSPLARFTLEGASNRDWEDIALGPGPVAGIHYLYVGDIGDNRRTRNALTIYRVPEPLVSTGERRQLKGAVALRFRYPKLDGAHDAEALMSDPRTGDLYVVTKNRTKRTSGVYRYPSPQDPIGVTVLEKIATLELEGYGFAIATTAADISPSGAEIAIRTYTRGFVWPRGRGQSIADALAQPPCPLALHDEIQGESLAWSHDGGALYTTGERMKQGVQPLHRHDRIVEGPSPGAAR